MADSCNKKFGVKNLMIGFRPCNGEPNIAPIAYELYEDVPQWRLVNHTAESLPGESGHVQYKPAPMKAELSVVVLRWIPLRYYQGDAAIYGHVEYYDGRVYTLVDTVVTGDEKSNGHFVKLMLDAEFIDEKLFESAPAG